MLLYLYASLFASLGFIFTANACLKGGGPVVVERPVEKEKETKNERVFFAGGYIGPGMEKNDPGSGAPSDPDGADVIPELPGSGGPLSGMLEEVGEEEEEEEEEVDGEEAGEGTPWPLIDDDDGGQQEGEGTPGPGQSAGVGGPGAVESQRGSGGPSGGNECGLGGERKDRYYGNCEGLPPSEGDGTTTGSATTSAGGGSSTDGFGSTTDGAMTSSEGATTGTGGGSEGSTADGDGGDPDGGGYGKGEDTTTQPFVTAQPIDPDELLGILLGPGVTYSPLDPSLYNEQNGGPVVVEGDLDCDVDNACCWNNAVPPSDQLDFQVGEGEIDPAMVQSILGADRPPDGKFLVAVANGLDPLTEAQLVSCSIVCTDEPITVSLMHWTTNEVQIQVCERDSFYDYADKNPLLHCMDVPKTETPGPSKVVLPPGEMFDVVIAVRNFASPTGDVALIDNIRVDYILCPAQPAELITAEATTTSAAVVTTPEVTTSASTDSSAATDATGPTDGDTTSAGTPTGDIAAECQSMECDFEDGTMCSYTSVTTVEAKRIFFKGPIKRIIGERELRNKAPVFRAYGGRIFNYVTGIYKAAQGTHFTAVYLRDKKAAIIRTEYKLTEKRVIRAKYYGATANFEIFACCFTAGKPKCTRLKKGMAFLADRQWKDVQFTCEAETSEVYFICSAKKSKNQGACGLDDIKLYYYDESLYKQLDTTVQLQPVCE